MKFNYQARTKEGQIQSGVVEASSKEAALNLLQNYRVYVTYLEPVETPAYAKKIELFQGISGKDLVVFTRQLAIMCTSNVPLVEALHGLASQIKKTSLKEKIGEITIKVEGGSPLSQALATYPDVFSPFFVGMVKAGETSGKLSEVLEYLADHIERENDFYSKIIMAMVYPAFVIAVFLVILAAMVIFVIPQLTQVLKESGQELPWVTKIVVNFSDFAVKWWQLLLIGFIGLIILGFQGTKTKEGKSFFDQISLKLPVLGDFFRKIYLTRFAENFSTLISSGLPIIQAIDITGEIIGNIVYKNILAEVGEGVKKGESISSILSKHPETFPPLFLQMTVVGERTGQLDTSLLNVVRFYQKDVERTLDTLISLLEPIMIIGLGVMVGGLVAAILLPIYQIGMT